MAPKDVNVTVIGWVGTNPRFYPAEGRSVAYTQFRMGHTQRELDRNTGELSDGPTSWFTVKSFRDMAVNVSECIRQGDPVVVHGRLQIEEWLGAEEQLQRTPVVMAEAIGPDLRWGTTRFRRTVRPACADPDAPDGQPVARIAPAEDGDAGQEDELPHAMGG
ncbi:single-stranded DNA-binding protein [Cellulomonas denverensis]|uniref:single-stranded DNA-binding protein n=1 Tax=Cellulomonas denverensis TaxID=264297 RepID=UPI0035E8C024